jgi:hypothetical protein
VYEINLKLKLFLLQPRYGPGVYSASNRKKYQKQKNNISRGKAQPVRKADITAIGEPIV